MKAFQDYMLSILKLLKEAMQERIHPDCSKLHLAGIANSRKVHFYTNFSTLSKEQTLYHEIGHHASKHKIGEHTSDKEKEADRYAYKLMRQSHPFLCLFSRLLNKLGFQNRKNYYRWGL